MRYIDKINKVKIFTIIIISIIIIIVIKIIYMEGRTKGEANCK